MRKIPIRSFHKVVAYAIVDDEDYDYLSGFSWWFRWGYVRTWSNGKGMTMHRMVNKTPPGLLTDHINGNRKDNRKSNLRSVTRWENGMKKMKARNNTSGYTGVFYEKRDRRWRAQIKYKNKYRYLGQFISKRKAYYAYRRAALKLFGLLATRDRNKLTPYPQHR